MEAIKSQNILKELKALKGLNDILVGCYNDLVMIDKEFQSYMASLQETGIQVEACKTFEQQYYQVDKANFKAIADRIIHGDLPIIRKKNFEPLIKQLSVASDIPLGADSFKLASPVAASSVSAFGKAINRKGDAQDYMVQLEGLCDLMDFLVRTRDRMGLNRDCYQKLCNNLVAEYVPVQVAQHYEVNYAQHNIKNINTAIAHIQNDDYAYLKSLYAATLNTLNELGRYPYSQRSPMKM